MPHYCIPQCVMYIRLTIMLLKRIISVRHWTKGTSYNYNRSVNECYPSALLLKYLDLNKSSLLFILLIQKRDETRKRKIGA